MLAGCDPHAAEINTAAVEQGKGKQKGKMTDEDWQEKREKYKDVACSKAIYGKECPHHAEGKCFYNHYKNVVAAEKAKAEEKKKRGSGKGKEGGKGKEDRPQLTPEQFKEIPCRNFKATGKCAYGD